MLSFVLDSDSIGIMKKIIIIHYNEIALKGQNRPYFEKALVANIKSVLRGEKFERISNLFGRIIIELGDESRISSIEYKLKMVFGIAYFVVGFSSSRDLDVLQRDVWSLVGSLNFDSFRVTTKRSDKSFQYKSQEMGILIGSYIWQQIEKNNKKPKVDLKNPDLDIVIEVTTSGIFFYIDFQGRGKIKCFSGLPARTAGKVVSLISSGFDSPVASWKMMRRGAEVVFVHFHSYPSTSLASKENVREIIRTLTKYQSYSKSYFVPFLNIQKAIMLNCDPTYGVILYRRFMIRIAEKIAEIENAKALVTGDSLAQVASQTLENINTVSEAARLPILRPLIGENKEDVIELAQVIDTFKISSNPYEDCCSLFVPRHPKTRSRIEDVRFMEQKLDVETLVNEAISDVEIEIFKYPESE